MSNKNIDYDFIINEFLKDVLRVADKEYQRRVWVEAIGPEVDDFCETANFIGDGKDILNHYWDFNITEQQRRLFQEFLCEFHKFPYSVEFQFIPADIIDSPEWTRITEIAKNVLKAFHWKSTPPLQMKGQSTFLTVFLTNVWRLSSRENQQRMWINEKSTDFRETFRSVLADGQILVQKSEEEGLSDKQHLLLNAFLQEVDLFVNTTAKNALPIEWIDTPEWDHIIRMAHEVLRVFRWKENRGISSA